MNNDNNDMIWGVIPIDEMVEHLGEETMRIVDWYAKRDGLSRKQVIERFVDSRRDPK